MNRVISVATGLNRRRLIPNVAEYGAALRITVLMVGTGNAGILVGSQQDAGVPREAAYHQFHSRGSPFIS
jgi:hypothetical protein